MRAAIGTGAIVVVITLALLLSGVLSGGREQQQAIGPDATPTIAQIFQSPAPSPPRPPTIRPTPTVEPGRGEFEPTLIEVETGRTLGLWTPGALNWVSPPSFTANGSTMVYAAGLGDESRVYSVNLNAPLLQAVEIGHGFQPRISPDGRYIAVAQKASIEIWPAAGNRFTLASPGVEATWSPDSRWLVYLDPARDTDEALPVYLVSTGTWQERVVAHYVPCGCDGKPGPRWASNSRFFGYGSIVPGSGIVSIEALPVEDLPRFTLWHPDGVRYLWSERVTPDAGSFDVGIYDLRNGRTISLTREGHGVSEWSGDGRFLATPVGPFLHVFAQDGSRIGEFAVANSGWISGHRWSQNSMLAVKTPGTMCGESFTLFRVPDTRPWGCAGGVGHDAAPPAWSPVADVLVTTEARPLSPGDATPYAPLSHDVFLIDAQTGRQRVIATDIRGHMSCFAWSPDGRFVVFYSCGI